MPLVLILGMLAQQLLVPSDVLGQTNPSPTPAGAGPSAADTALINQVKQATGGQAEVSTHEETGKVRFIGTTQDKPIAAARASASASPEAGARDFLNTYGPLFGIQDQAKELTTLRTKNLDAGASAVRFKQAYKGIPVFAGDLVVNLDAKGNVLSANGEISPGIDVSTSPKVGAGQAAQAAIDVTAKHENVAASSLTASAPELIIYDNRLISAPGRGARLVWKVEVTAGATDPIRELVLVDAQNGAIALDFNQIADAKNRQTFTGNNTTALPGTLVCNESNPLCTGGDTDAVAAHRYTGDTYDFYMTRFGRDSIDGAGMILKSTVHHRVNYQNAFWNGIQMVYGDGYGFARADDVVGHELTHGVTEFESGLIYFGQSGAINESLSDVFGELMDQVNGAGTDTAGVKWLEGEDITGLGAIRNMADPPAFSDPDRTGSSFWNTGNSDNRGVHTNSGVNNKAVFLIVDGGTFNGQTVTGLGIEKAAQIYYRAQVSGLTTGSAYVDLFDILPQSCTNLVGSFGITHGDCNQVKKAVIATEMNLTPFGGVPAVAAVCPAGQGVTNLFFDNLENTASGNWAHGAVTGTIDNWFYPPTFSYATSGIRNFEGYNGPAVSDSAIRMTSSVALPAGAFMRFEHSHLFESSTTSYDGGVVEYSITGGSTWLDAGPLFDTGGYNGTIGTSFSNPLGGRQAFTRWKDYGSSRLNLSTLAGQSVRFRFRMGTDNSVDADGWFIDDIQIYTCGGTARPAASTLSAPSGTVGTNPTFTWSALSPAPTGYALYDLAPSGTSYDIVQVFGAGVCSGGTCSVPSPVTLAAGTHIAWVIAYNGTGWGAWSEAWSYCVTSCTVERPLAPSLISPASNALSSNPISFVWNRLTGPVNFYALYDLPAGSGTYDIVQAFNSSQIATMCGATTCTYTHTSALGAGGHTFWVIANNAAGWGAFSPPRNYCITTCPGGFFTGGAEVPAPTVPTGSSATATPTAVPATATATSATTTQTPVVTATATATAPAATSTPAATATKTGESGGSGLPRR